MKDLKKLAMECEAELQAIGITCGYVRNWSVNTRARSRWGQCKLISKGIFDIDISARLLQDGTDVIAAKTTIIHELLHTVEGCQGHKGKWKELAELVGKAYPQYQIKRTSSYEEKGLSREDAPQQGSNLLRQENQPSCSGQSHKAIREQQARYRITCTDCGARAYRQRASRLIQRPEDFRCGKCGGKLLVEVRVD